MIPVANLDKHNTILHSLNMLPCKIIELHGSDHNVPAFILYDFCRSESFNLDKAAYFIENPDFKEFKGVAGICKNENGFCSGMDIWKEPEKYSNYMRQSPFNQKVRSFDGSRAKQIGQSQTEMIRSIAGELSINKPEYYSWNMKHDNQGYLIFERADGMSDEFDDHLKHGLHLLSFCAIH